MTFNELQSWYLSSKFWIYSNETDRDKKLLTTPWYNKIMHFSVGNVHMCMKQVSHTVPFFLLPELFFFRFCCREEWKKNSCRVCYSSIGETQFSVIVTPHLALFLALRSTTLLRHHTPFPLQLTGEEKIQAFHPFYPEGGLFLLYFFWCQHRKKRSSWREWPQPN